MRFNKLTTLVLPIIAAMLLAPHARSQSYLPVTASNITDAGGNPLANGTWCAIPTDNLDNPITLNVGSSGSPVGNAIPSSVCATVTAGVIVGPVSGSGTFQLANPSQAYPANSLYRVTITDTNAGTSVVYKGVTVSGNPFDWDHYYVTSPTIPATNWLTGPEGPGGPDCSTSSPSGQCYLASTETASANGALDPTACGRTGAPSWCSGSDLGAWVNAAGAYCSWNCPVVIPPGSYTQTTTVLVPITTYMKFTLSCAAGALISYTGSGYWFDTALGATTPSSASITEDGCVVTGTSSALGATRIRPGGQISVTNNLFKNFTNGDGVTNEGANDTVISHNNIVYGKNGVRYFATKCLNASPFTCSPTESGTTTGYAPNHLQIEYNGFSSLTGYGVQEDETQGFSSQDLNNQIFHNTFEEDNEGVLLSYSLEAILTSNYFEGNPHNIVVGTGCCNNTDVLIKGNYFTISSSTPYTIELVTAIGTTVSGNLESGTGSTCFVNQTTTLNTYFGPNTTASANPYCQGGSAGHTSTDMVSAPGGQLFSNPTMGYWQVTGVPSVFSTQGAYASWNATLGNGETDFVNDKGSGVGGFNWYNVANGATSVGTSLMSLDQSGNLTVHGGMTVSGGIAGIHTNTASNTDLAGQLTLSAGAASYSFTGTYTSSPICTANDTTALDPVKAAVTTTTLTLTGTGTDVVNYICIDRN